MCQLQQLDVISVALSPNGKGRKEKGKRGHSAERRRKVDHWVPAIWIPDGKNEFLYEMWSKFWVASTRHHCRLCGRCNCASSSGWFSSIYYTFLSWSNFGFLSDHFLLQTFSFRINAKQDSLSSSTKPARACDAADACYDTVFPVINPPPTGGFATDIDKESHKSDTIPSLLHLPSWLSLPSLPVGRQPHALMATDTTLLHVHLHREMNHHCLLRTHHHLRFFLNRWSRSYLWCLPVQSLTVVNARLISLQNEHTGRVSYSYNVQDARIGMYFNIYFNIYIYEIYSAATVIQKDSLMIYSILCLTDIWLQTHLGSFKESKQGGKLRSIEELLKAKGEKVWRGKLDLDGTVEKYTEWSKDLLENRVGCARFLAFLWWFLVPTNMYYDRSLTSVTPCWSSTLPIFDLASFHIHLLGHCNIFTPNAKQIRTLLWAGEPIITSLLAFFPMTQWSDKNIISSSLDAARLPFPLHRTTRV